MNHKRQTLSYRMHSSSSSSSITTDKQKQNAEQREELERIDQLMNENILIHKYYDINVRKSKLKQKQEELLVNLQKLSDLKAENDRNLERVKTFEKQLKLFVMLSKTLANAERYEKFAHELRFNYCAQRIPFESNNEMIISTLSDTIKQYQSIKDDDDEGAYSKQMEFQAEILKILDENNPVEFKLKNNNSSFQQIRQLLQECKLQRTRMDQLNEQMNQYRQISEWISRQK